MKYLLSLLWLVTLSTNLKADVIKCKGYGFSYQYTNPKTGYTGPWATWTETDILITIDIENERIRIFSENEQDYNIIQFLGEKIDRDGDKIMRFVCVNEDGKKCNIRIVKLLSKDGTSQLYVDFSNITWVYNFYRIN